MKCLIGPSTIVLGLRVPEAVFEVEIVSLRQLRHLEEEAREQ